jgi:hypothetical protein
VSSQDSDTSENFVRRHLRFGWWSLLLFATFGLTLEILHGFKAKAYVDVSNETRRLMWTLAHAHGSLLALIHIACAATISIVGCETRLVLGRISMLLIGASLLLPGGFFLGGVVVYSGDPGIGIALVPFGAGLLLIAVMLIARGTASVALSAKGQAGRAVSKRMGQKLPPAEKLEADKLQD